MTDKSAKKKAKKGAKASAQPSVLGSLPATRPSRMGRAREDGGTPSAEPTAAARKPRAARSTAATKPPAAAKSKAAPKPSAATASKAAKTPSGAATSGAATKLRATPPPPRPSGPPSGARLVTTAVQAAGEVVQIGASAGVRALKRAASRLPRP